MKKIILLILLVVFKVGYSQIISPTEIDESYNYKANVFINTMSSPVILQNGKILSVINGTINNVSHTNCLVRLNADLSLDESFPLGKFTGLNSLPSILMQPDGKILVSINASSSVSAVVKYNETVIHDGIYNRYFLIRLNQDGTLDNTFSLYNIGNTILKFKILTDGKILVHKANEILIMLDANGNYINSPFSGNYYVDNFFQLSNGRIFIIYGSSSNYYIREMNNNGQIAADFQMVSLTSTFQHGIYGPISDIQMQSDGKLIIAGRFSHINNEPREYLARLNTDGALDNSFALSTSGVQSGLNANLQYTQINSISIQPNNKILIVGNFSSYNGISSKGLIRFNTDASIDTSLDMSVGFDVQNNNPTKVISLSDDQMLIWSAVKFKEYSTPGVFKLDGLGNLMNLPSFNHQTKKVIYDSNQNILLVGNTTYASQRGLKLNDANGNIIDNLNLRLGFNSNGNSFYPDLSCNDAIMQPDGKILVCGLFQEYNENPANKIIRLNQDYSIDTTFLINGFNNNNVVINNLALQADGKIFVTGDLGDSYNGNPITSKLIRLNADGTLDTSFAMQVNQPVGKMFIQSNGKVILPSTNGLVRVNLDGTIDNTFTSTPLANVLLLLEDDKLLVRSTNQILRLNADGTPDSNFVPIPIVGTYDFAIYVQPDGRILKSEQVYSGQAYVYKIVRYNIDSSIDLAFQSGFFNSNINHISMDSYGRIFVAGSFTRYNGAWCNGTMRLLGGEAYLVHGTNRLDSNINGCDVSDYLYPFLKFNVSYNGISNDYISNSSGNYAIPFAVGTHTITPTLENPSYFIIIPLSISVNFPNDPSPYLQNFCITPNGNHADLEIAIFPTTPARPGFNGSYKIVYKNKGNQMQSGTVSLLFDDAVLDFVSSIPYRTSIVGNTITWNFSNLAPMEKREITLTFNANSSMESPSLNGGDILSFTASVSSSLVDENPNDNVFDLNQTVVNSYDPNDKTCLQGENVTSGIIGNYVHYVIRFENTGTYNAQNISITDYIDTSKFDISTLVPLTGSHLFVTKISEGNKVEFYFENINLPFQDATNDGFVAFKIKTKPNLAVGDSFSNSANIYFDYNSAIITNEYVSTIQALSSEDFDFKNYFTVYPNPVESILNISRNNNILINNIAIYNVLGQLVISIPNAESVQNIDVSKLSEGQYFIVIKTDKGISNTKFIKK